MADSKHTRDEAKAEADRLRDAAPDLLEALIEALPFVVFAETEDGYKPGAVRTVSTRIRAAIAKAEGRS